MPSAADIRVHYPDPVEEYRANTTNYCIGGACLMFRTGDPLASHANCERFPDEADLARVLQAYNPTLSWEDAFRFATAVIAHNDTGNFAEGWHVVDQALQHGCP